MDNLTYRSERERERERVDFDSETINSVKKKKKYNRGINGYRRFSLFNKIEKHTPSGDRFAEETTMKEELCMEIDPPFRESLATADEWRKALDKVVPAIVVLHTTACRAFDTEAVSASYATDFVVDKRCGIIPTNIRHIVKPAVARPRFDANQNPIFSGKIGIFPFTYKEPAKRSSKNKPTGTLETKAITEVAKEITRSCLIEKILPAIRSKWPCLGAVETVYIQQDNARPHIHGSDPEFLEAASRDGFDMRLVFQPPNSPDMNVLDLGFFRAIQSLQHQQAPSTIDELVNVVKKSFEEYPMDQLDRVFLTFQAFMIEVMKVYGDNNYNCHTWEKKPRNGTLPSQLHYEYVIVENAQLHLHQ